MKTLRGTILVLWGMAGCAAAAAAGCGGNTSTSGGGEDAGGSDGTVDQASEGSQQEESSSDSPQAVPEASIDATLDTGSSPDTGSSSGEAGEDATGDADGGGTPDATDATIDATDASLDAPDGTVSTPDASDSGAPPDAADGSAELDASEAGPSDAAPEANPIFAFPSQVANSLCGQISNCCGFGPDASNFNMPQCVSQVLPNGYSATLLGSTGLLDSGELTFDPVKGQACLNDIAAIDCSSNQLTSAVQKKILSDCTAAMVGTLGVGADCNVTIQCAPGEYCDLPTDGGQGACAALQSQGGSCYFGIHSFALSEEACGFRRTGSAGLRCNNADLEAGVANPPSAWVCTPQQAEAGATCFFNQDCTSGLCDLGPSNNINKCANAETFIYPSACAGFILDAGGGG